ncbi:MAG: DsrH/TusB family sulfur metabolism protein [candidate division WOR-3 bacterium]
MKTLYLFTQTPNEFNIKLLKNLIDDTDCVIFIQNGVYFARHELTLGCQGYVLNADLKARGIETGLKTINYDELVDLFFTYERIVTI